MQTKPLLIFSLLLLSACSPHPVAGGWKADSSAAAFAHLEISYNGQATFHTNAPTEEAAWRCFWGAEDKKIAHLKCVQASNAEVEKTYRLVANKAEQTAELTLNGQSLGRYTWQPPTDQSE